MNAFLRTKYRGFPNVRRFSTEKRPTRRYSFFLSPRNSAVFAAPPCSSQRYGDGFLIVGLLYKPVTKIRERGGVIFGRAIQTSLRGTRLVGSPCKTGLASSGVNRRKKLSGVNRGQTCGKIWRPIRSLNFVRITLVLPHKNRGTRDTFLC